MYGCSADLSIHPVPELDLPPVIDNTHRRGLLGLAMGSAVTPRRMSDRHASDRGATHRGRRRAHDVGAQSPAGPQPDRPAAGARFESADGTCEARRWHTAAAQGAPPPPAPTSVAAADIPPAAEAAEAPGAAPPMPSAPGLANMPTIDCSGCIALIGACISPDGACSACGAACITACIGCMNVLS